jgi:hypothetical protein
MSKQTNAIAVSTIGIDTGKNTLHMIGLDEKGEIILREKISRRNRYRRLSRSRFGKATRTTSGMPTRSRKLCSAPRHAAFR